MAKAPNKNNGTKPENETAEPAKQTADEEKPGKRKRIAEDLDISLDTLNQLEQSWKSFRETVIEREKNRKRMNELKEDLKQVRRQLKRASGEQLDEARERERVIKEELNDLQSQPHTPKILDKKLREWVMSSESTWENFLSAKGAPKPQGFVEKMKNWFSPKESEREKMWEKIYDAWEQGK
jgi:DNA repair exonuclease SbcCD ATPase subunit